MDNSNEELMDEYGYPTEKTLEKIRNWQFKNDESCYKEFFEFIRELWMYGKDGYWHEKENVTQDENGSQYDIPRHQYYISTAGWSGNEEIIAAMKENWMLWTLCWVQVRRGGHYLFEVKEHGK